MRLLAIALAMVLSATVFGFAQDAAPGRFAIEPSVDGFVRLDTETGAVSHCYRRDDVWRCDVLAEDRSAIAEVADEVRALNNKLDDLTARIEALETRDQAAVPHPVEPKAGFAEVLMQRLFDLVRDIRGEGQASS